MNGLISINRITNPSEALKYQKLTFPKYISLLKDCNQPNVYIFGAVYIYNKRKLSVALIVCINNTYNYFISELISIFVVTKYRRLGIGTKLFNTLRSVLRTVDCRQITTTFMDNLKETKQFVNWLKKQSWEKPIKKMDLFRAETESLKNAEWFYLFQKLPNAYSIINWAKLTIDQRNNLLFKINNKSDSIPNDLNPFNFERIGHDGAKAYNELCFALIYNDEIVGWHISHLINKESIRFSCSYILSKIQNQMLLLSLWVYAFNLISIDIKYVSWGVDTKHTKMSDFNIKYMKPYCIALHKSYFSKIYI